MPFATRLGFVPLNWHLVFWILAIVLAYLFAAEFVKRFIYKRLQTKNTQNLQPIAF
jgi:hypothetical protein